MLVFVQVLTQCCTQVLRRRGLGAGPAQLVLQVFLTLDQPTAEEYQIKDVPFLKISEM